MEKDHTNCDCEKCKRNKKLNDIFSIMGSMMKSDEVS